MTFRARSSSAVAMRLIVLLGMAASRWLSGAEDRPSVQSWLAETVIPKVEFDEVTLEEALEFLRASAKEHGDREPAPLVWSEAQPSLDETSLVSLSLEKVPLAEALEYTLELAGGFHYRVQGENIVVARDPGVPEGELVTRRYAVPHNFLDLAISGDGDSDEDDPFAGEPDRGCRLWPMSLPQLLENVGIPFPRGTSTTLDQGSRILTVRNTEPCHELVKIFVDAVWDLVPDVISLRAELYLLPRIRAIALLDEAEESETVAALRLRELAGTPGAELCDLLSVATLVEVPAVSSSGGELEFVAGYIAEGGKDTAVHDSIHIGTRLEATVQNAESGEVLVDVVGDRAVEDAAVEGKGLQVAADRVGRRA